MRRQVETDQYELRQAHSLLCEHWTLNWLVLMCHFLDQILNYLVNVLTRLSEVAHENVWMWWKGLRGYDCEPKNVQLSVYWYVPNILVMYCLRSQKVRLCILDNPNLAFLLHGCEFFLSDPMTNSFCKQAKTCTYNMGILWINSIVNQNFVITNCNLQVHIEQYFWGTEFYHLICKFHRSRRGCRNCNVKITGLSKLLQI